MSHAHAPQSPSLSTPDWSDPRRQADFNTWLSHVAPLQGLDITSVHIASADASFRRYFRVNSTAGSRIIMDAPPEKEDCRPFAKVAQLMAQAGVHAPQVLAWDEARGFMLLTDLGAHTMMQVIQPDNPLANRGLYLQAIDALIAWQLASRDQQVAFFMGEPVQVAGRVWSWFMPFGFGPSTLFPDGLPGRADIYVHLGTTLLETVLAFVIGTALGLACGLWLALAPTAGAILDPYIKAANSMPRVILAPIFGLWFGLGIWSKVALAVTLVFFIVFFNVYQGVKEVSPVVLANARMLGANQRQLLRTVYLPSATSWVFSSLHTSVGLAFVGAVVGEYLGSARGVGYLILQAEGTFDVNTVFAGIVVLTAFALVLDGMVGRLEKRLMKWQPRTGETEKL